MITSRKSKNNKSDGTVLYRQLRNLRYLKIRKYTSLIKKEEKSYFKR